MWKLRPLLSRSHRNLLRDVRAERERGDRLEIQVRRQQLRLDELATDLERLSDRLCATQGRLLGGGSGKRRSPGSGQQELRLEDIPKGDKKALREFFRTHPPSKNTTDETEH